MTAESDSLGVDRTPVRTCGAAGTNAYAPRTWQGHGRYPTWGALRWLFLFRLLLVIGLILTFSPKVLDPALRPADTALAWNILVVYALVVLLSGLGLSLHWPSRMTQVQSAIFLDILTLTALMHIAGGISSGLGILLAVAVAAGALMMEGRLSLFFASLASLAIMSQQIYSSMSGEDLESSFTQAGFLGLLYFAVALLSHVLYRRVRSAEALAARRKVDIDDLSKLNDFIIHSIGTGILVADGERCLRLANDAALDLLAARRTRPGASLNELSPQLADWLTSQVQLPYPKDGLIRIGEREIHASIKLLGEYRASGVVVYLRDNQEAAREAQQIKLASLGTLTASIAHNIRNPLSSVSHASELLSETPHLNADDRHLLDIIRRNSARIEETVQSVLQLSHSNQVVPSAVDLSTWTESFLTEIREGRDLDASCILLEIDTQPVMVEVDPRHLHQILANLFDNALVHAKREGQETCIHLRVGRTENRDEALLEIRDNGPGIDAATTSEIFNPFFTTKSQGTGLGLYIARELAESNGIRLTHAPVEPCGTCFKLVFARD